MTCFNAVHGTDSAALGARLVTSLSLLKQSGEVKKENKGIARFPKEFSVRASDLACPRTPRAALAEGTI